MYPRRRRQDHLHVNSALGATSEARLQNRHQRARKQGADQTRVSCASARKRPVDGERRVKRSPQRPTSRLGVGTPGRKRTGPKDAKLARGSEGAAPTARDAELDHCRSRGDRTQIGHNRSKPGPITAISGDPRSPYLRGCRRPHESPNGTELLSGGRGASSNLAGGAAREARNYADRVSSGLLPFSAVTTLRQHSRAVPTRRTAPLRVWPSATAVCRRPAH
jgi:hypothetical protein